MQLVFDILSWGAWSQDFQDKESWSGGDKCASESLSLKGSNQSSQYNKRHH